LRALWRKWAIPSRVRATGYRTLLRTIVGQQVSVAAAASVWARMEALLGEDMPPEVLLAADFDALRGCGLSRQKQGYARSLCELVASGELDLAALPADDEAAIARLVRIKGVGRWSAEIYLLLPKGGPISGPPETWRCRWGWASCWACRNGRASGHPRPGRTLAPASRCARAVYMALLCQSGALMPQLMPARDARARDLHHRGASGIGRAMAPLCARAGSSGWPMSMWRAWRRPARCCRRALVCPPARRARCAGWDAALACCGAGGRFARGGGQQRRGAAGGELADCSVAEIERVIAVNLTGATLGARAAYPWLAQAPEGRAGLPAQHRQCGGALWHAGTRLCRDQGRAARADRSARRRMGRRWRGAALPCAA
jgi:hypothetical protein